MDTPAKLLQLSSELIGLRDALTNLSLIFKDFKADVDLQQSGPAKVSAAEAIFNAKQIQAPVSKRESHEQVNSRNS